jgi:hypothetical protein
VLIAGLKGLSDGTMSVYHFTIITDLAWFSSSTHLFSLVVRRCYDESAKRRSEEREEHRGWRLRLPIIVRVALMLLLASLLLFVCWVSGYSCWYQEFRCPALCTVSGSKGGVPLQWTIVNFVLILYAYPIHMLQLSFTARKFWMHHVREHILPEQVAYCGRLPRKPRALLSMAFLTAWNVLASEVSHAVELIVWFSFGCLWIGQDRARGHEILTDSELEEEDKVGIFSQLVPLLLLLLPFIQLIQCYASMCEDRDRRKRQAGRDAIVPSRGNFSLEVGESNAGQKLLRVSTI